MPTKSETSASDTGEQQQEHPYRYAGLLVLYRQFPRPSHAHADANQTDHQSAGQTADAASTVHNDSHSVKGFDTEPRTVLGSRQVSPEANRPRLRAYCASSGR
jgi:hypothetical protein